MAAPDTPNIPPAPGPRRPATPHIVLLGLRCSGKTTVGRLLAARLKRPFVDLDDRTAAAAGFPSAGAALAAKGEPAFRSVEFAALVPAISAPDPSILALGGGTPTSGNAEATLVRARARREATLVYLAARPQTLGARLARESESAARPPLLPGGPRAEAEALFLQRDPLYRAIADHTVVTDSLTPDQVAETVLRALNLF